ncbi:MAG: cbb3-type cytochrome c oxidase subunit II [Luteolibacter sp.]|uniref:cbb3-type cytochrome c oxidase subunit II n=1 Tax=Luteolibacter sp. TaxID=1962973 RepID=UPI0032642A49
MSFRTFILGLSASFGIAWLAIVVVPFIKMRNLAPIQLNEATDGTTGIFFPKRTGRVADGALVYAENGCYLCHTQVVRPTYAGNDLYRSDWGGLKADADRGDTRRETNAYDFFGEKFAQIGVARMGPDLSNLGRRVEAIYATGGDPAKWLYGHLYDPRSEPKRWKSTCPSFRFLFKQQPVTGDISDDALPFGHEDGMEIIPTSDAKALVSYLLSLKKDQKVPAALDFAPAKKKG